MFSQSQEDEGAAFRLFDAYRQGQLDIAVLDSQSAGSHAIAISTSEAALATSSSGPSKTCPSLADSALTTVSKSASSSPSKASGSVDSTSDQACSALPRSWRLPTDRDEPRQTAPRPGLLDLPSQASPPAWAPQTGPPAPPPSTTTEAQLAG
ncbi:unnamed protein product [Protopolystoma xenopodis]|uniref:Uncharacterized protein n=1 Tax=Protopolystoma xenopodis TaxID=117903 RepID=A0A3S5FCI7_9PLAT|nr:unnamed protein product [Protopolystoma xenopodis]